MENRVFTEITDSRFYQGSTTLTQDITKNSTQYSYLSTGLPFMVTTIGTSFSLTNSTHTTTVGLAMQLYSRDFRYIDQDYTDSAQQKTYGNLLQYSTQDTTWNVEEYTEWSSQLNGLANGCVVTNQSIYCETDTIPVNSEYSMNKGNMFNWTQSSHTYTTDPSAVSYTTFSVENISEPVWKIPQAVTTSSYVTTTGTFTRDTVKMTDVYTSTTITYKNFYDIMSYTTSFDSNTTTDSGTTYSTYTDNYWGRTRSITSEDTVYGYNVEFTNTIYNEDCFSTETVVTVVSTNIVESTYTSFDSKLNTFSSTRTQSWFDSDAATVIPYSTTQILSTSVVTYSKSMIGPWNTQSSVTHSMGLTGYVDYRLVTNNKSSIFFTGQMNMRFYASQYQPYAPVTIYSPIGNAMIVHHNTDKYYTETSFLVWGDLADAGQDSASVSFYNPMMLNIKANDMTLSSSYSNVLFQGDTISSTNQAVIRYVYNTYPIMQYSFTTINIPNVRLLGGDEWATGSFTASVPTQLFTTSNVKAFTAATLGYVETFTTVGTTSTIYPNPYKGE